jgi:DNA helicase-2/ATP-dependent DNA helicase PcrA
MTILLTSEQQAILKHPRGAHARILAVAGSGKTTTMAQLVKTKLAAGMSHRAMIVLMFNSNMRAEFTQKLIQLGLPATAHPDVHTFHSYARQVLDAAMKRGLMPTYQMQWGDGSVRFEVKKIISELARRTNTTNDQLDTDEALSAIGLWKSELIPPDHNRARSTGNAKLVDVYLAFEERRHQELQMTYDDWIPKVVELFDANPSFRADMTDRFGFVVIDEYQDVNYGQQRMIEHVAGQNADIVVVGDDDQTIYEWRGARPDFILRVFADTFAGKKVIDYTLSRSFRFGPIIAQTALNVIRNNTMRMPKKLTAHDIHRNTTIHIVSESGSPNDPDDDLCERLAQTLKDLKDWSSVVVIGRTYSQLQSLEAACLKRRIPYYVEDQQPFFKRDELLVFLDYIHCGMRFHTGLDGLTIKALENILNRPNRMLKKSHFSAGLQEAQLRGHTIQELFNRLAAGALQSSSSHTYRALAALLEQIHLRALHGASAGDVLQLIYDTAGFAAHLLAFYGNSEEAYEHINRITQFIGYARSTNLPVTQITPHIQTLNSRGSGDPTREVRFTTVYKTKGLEFDHVFVPRCHEGFLPVTLGNGLRVYDAQKGTAPIVATPDSIQNERRLFYVALTRAKRTAFLGISANEYADEGNGSNQKRRKPEQSRFLGEMALYRTAQIFDTLVPARNGELWPLHRLLLQTGASQELLDQLVEYLPDQRKRAALIASDAEIRRW